MGTSPHRWPSDLESEPPGKLKCIPTQLTAGWGLGWVRRGTGWVEGGPVSTHGISHQFQVKAQRTRKAQGSYHPVVKHPVQQGGVVVVLAVQVLTHNLDVCLLAHLLG